MAISGLQTIRTIKASALESDFFEKWAGHFARLMNTQQGIDLLNQSLGLLPVFLSGMMTILILAAGGFRVMSGALTIGQLVAFQALMTSFLLPVNSLVSLGSVMQLLETDLARWMMCWKSGGSGASVAGRGHGFLAGRIPPDRARGTAQRLLRLQSTGSAPD